MATRSYSRVMEFSCDYDGCSFKTKFEHSFRAHRESWHEQEQPAESMSDSNSDTASVAGSAQIVGELQEEPPFTCPRPGCDYRTSDRRAFEDHISGVHENHKKYMCDHAGCTFKTAYRQSLQRHRNTLHCNMQNSSYLKPRGPNRRITNKRVITEAVEQSMQSPPSPPQSSTASTITVDSGLELTSPRPNKRRVRRQRLAEYRYTCPHSGCGYKTNVRSSLGDHICGVHEHRTRYRCDTVGCSFKTAFRQSLLSHKRRFHDQSR